jgi:hypothetical protein
MPTATYIALANTTVSSTTNSVTFSSIPATYRDLVVVTNPIGDGYLSMQFNADTGNNYSYIAMFGSGSAAQSQTGTIGRVPMTYPLTGSYENPTFFYIMDYSATDKHKTLLYRGNSAGAGVWAGASRWANTNAITSVKVFLDNGNFSAGSTLALYGIVS